MLQRLDPILGNRALNIYDDNYETVDQILVALNSYSSCGHFALVPDILTRFYPFLYP